MDTQVASDLEDVGVLALVAEHRIPGDHPHLREARQPLDDALGQAVGQIFEVPVLAAGERQHGDGGQGRRRRFRGAVPAGAQRDGGGHGGHSRRPQDTGAAEAGEHPGAEPSGAGGHRLAAEMAIDVFGQPAGGGVAAGRFLLQCGQHDRVEIAGELPALGEPFSGAAARIDHPARWRRDLLVDDPLRLLPSQALQPVRRTPGQELVQQHPQRVDVACGGDRFAAHLFRAGIARRHRPRELRVLAGGGAVLRIEQRGDAEVEQLRHAGVRHQDVAGLQIPMDHPVLVRVIDRFAHRAKQLEPPLDRQPILAAEDVDGQALDILDDEIRAAVLAAAAVEQHRDIRVIQVGQDLTLVQEAPDDGVRIHPALDQLDRDPPVIDPVASLRQVGGAHAAAPQLAEHAVRPDALADEVVRRIVSRGEHGPRALVGEWRGLEQGLGRDRRIEQRLHLGSKRGVRAVRRDEAAALALRNAEGAGGDGLDALPLFAGHRSCHTRHAR